MSEQFIGEIRVFSFSFPPQGWALCNGATLAIARNQALFSILGITYGGDGATTFKLPNLVGNVPVHPGNSIQLGSVGGEATHALITSEMPVHVHTVSGSSGSTSLAKVPAGNVWPTLPSNSYGTAPDVTMNPASVGLTGANQGHQNMQPYLALNYCIAMQGIYPSRS
jgi:microcystin-dependent protein